MTTRLQRERAPGLCALGLALVPVGCGRPAASERPPDVILVVVDTLRADRLHCYGYPRPTSPTIDRLADEGALFEDVTAQFAWTVPSMVSLLSGKYVTDWREVMTADDPSLVESFSDAGYLTLGVIANQLLDAKSGFRGFDLYDVRPSKAPTRKSDAERSRDLSELYEDVEPELARLAAAGRDRPPLFLYLHPFEPHTPYWPRRRFEGELPLDGALPAWPEAWHREALGRPEAEELEQAFESIGLYRGHYDHEIRYLDEQLGAVLEGLRSFGLLERAVVAIAADHGEGLWDHVSPDVSAGRRPGGPAAFFYGAHGAILNAEAIATPLILWGTGVPGGVRVPAPVENVDLAPTLLELCGLAVPESMDGRSLVPLTRGAPDERTHVFSYASDGRAMIRELRTGAKLVLADERPIALFDLAADPGERTNLVDARPELVERLRAEFVAWRQRHGDGRVADHLIRDDAEDLERLRMLGYTEMDIGR